MSGQPVKIMYKIPYLKTLALMGAGRHPVRLSSADLEERLNASSKTIARNLKNLEEAGLIDRAIVAGGQDVRINERGMDLLKKEFADYKMIFRVRETAEIEGTIVTGIGEGRYYVGVSGYRDQFRAVLGHDPFPGTLNVRIKESDIGRAGMIPEMPSYRINGFSDGERTYGSARCHPADIHGIECAIVVPERTHYHADLLEIISPVGIRKALDLKDGDTVRIIVRSANSDAGPDTEDGDTTGS